MPYGLIFNLGHNFKSMRKRNILKEKIRQMSEVKSDTILAARSSPFKAESSSHHINIFGGFYNDINTCIHAS